MLYDPYTAAHPVRQLMMEYTLIEGVNTSAETSHALGSLLARQRALVMLNLIPYNPTATGPR